MRYQLRLLDQNLAGFTRELAVECSRAVEAMFPDGPPPMRSVYRAVRGVLKDRVEAFRFCGKATSCEAVIVDAPPERFAPGPERFHLFMMREGTSIDAVVHEIVERGVKAIATLMPGRPLKGLTGELQRHVARAFRGRTGRIERCGNTALCGCNDVYDPWDRREPLNRVAQRA